VIESIVRSLPELELFLRLRLAQPLPGADAQWKFAPSPSRKGWRPDDTPATARRAAALILLYPGEHGPSFPLTVRHDDLPHHPGQISLPGGALDPGEDPAAGALREAHEEIGIHSRDVRLIGPMSSLWVVVSNFLVYPFIGITDTRPEFRAHPGEVARVDRSAGLHVHRRLRQCRSRRSHPRRNARPLSLLRCRGTPGLGARRG
jgi:8-oxo-dGTP pyrophosphatase MutT (NUDIX family)